ncbi:hypothetical protein [Kutzneria buriramensis]|uniref:Uncharacterized protein n=1 Tax=Kutzneria buriramensis TaxID=1045776 RepID=A0A3E0H258_9PSEU|nr:hypothetical protein [Kutzneria buriramensis]REH37124.1 hypothetical protein BCF44_115128 [Kutzneria buriramensis]
MSAAHTPVVPLGDLDELRELARGGRLGAQLSSPANARQARLFATLYSLVWPIVFDRLTRPLELRRGHRRCASRVTQLSPDCVDGFHDDVEAVVDGVRRRATVPINDLEAWIAGMARAATVDGYRRRRGQLGAPQRPRVPGWLSERLRHDPWLTALSLHIMEWVGVPMTAGHQLWPLDSWADRRAHVTGDWAGSTPEATAWDVERVLAAMRTRPLWYERNVEQPLGRKQTPAPMHPVSTPLALAPERDEEGVAEWAVWAICRRVDAGEDVREVAADVVRRAFHGRLSALRLARIVDAVVEILG